MITDSFYLFAQVASVSYFNYDKTYPCSPQPSLPYYVPAYAEHTQHIESKSLGTKKNKSSTKP